MLSLLLHAAVTLNPALPIESTVLSPVATAPVAQTRLAATSTSSVPSTGIKVKPAHKGKGKPVGGQSGPRGMTEEPTGPEECGNGIPCGPPDRPSGGSSGSGSGSGSSKPSPNPGTCIGKHMTEEPTGCE